MTRAPAPSAPRPSSRWVVTAVGPHELGQAVLAYAVLLFVKLAVYFVTGMLTILALALHSLSDLVLSVFLLLSTRMLRAQGGSGHAQAPERARSAAALVTAAVTISFVSFRLAEEAIAYLVNPRLALYSMPELAFALTLGSMLAGGVPIVRTLRAQRRLAWKALAGEPHAMAALNDELALLVGLGGIVLLNHGWRHADAWASLVIATLIAANAVGLARTHLHVLLGHPATSALRRAVCAAAAQVPGVHAVELIDAEERDGQLVRATLSITVARGTPIEVATAIAAAVSERLRVDLGCVDCLVIPVAPDWAAVEVTGADSKPDNGTTARR